MLCRYTKKKAEKKYLSESPFLTPAEISYITIYNMTQFDKLNFSPICWVWLPCARGLWGSKMGFPTNIFFSAFFLVYLHNIWIRLRSKYAFLYFFEANATFLHNPTRLSGEVLDIRIQTIFREYMYVASAWFFASPLESRVTSKGRLSKSSSKVANREELTSRALWRVWLRQYRTIVLVVSTFLFNS